VFLLWFLWTETWCHLFVPMRSTVGIQWRHPHFTLTKWIQVTSICWYSGGNCFLTLRDPYFWTSNHVMTQQMQTVNTCHPVQTLGPKSKNVCLAELTGSILLHDTVHPHVVQSSGPSECHGRCSIQLGVSTMQFWNLWAISEVPHRPYLQIRWWYVGGCSVVA
jgi:hypothetical protein